jgi:hypothetical protein
MLFLSGRWLAVVFALSSMAHTGIIIIIIIIIMLPIKP